MDYSTIYFEELLQDGLKEILPNCNIEIKTVYGELKVYITIPNKNTHIFMPDGLTDDLFLHISSVPIRSSYDSHKELIRIVNEFIEHFMTYFVNKDAYNKYCDD